MFDDKSIEEDFREEYFGKSNSHMWNLGNGYAKIKCSVSTFFEFI